MTVTRKAPARKPASKSGNPATAAAAREAADELAAQAAAAREAAAAEQAAQAAKIQAEFAAMTLPAPVFDEDGYEVIPDRLNGEGGSYKFKVKGHPFTLPNLRYLPLAIAQQLQACETEEQAQELIFGRYTPELMEHASQDELLHIMKRWTDYSKGVGLGE